MREIAIKPTEVKLCNAMQHLTEDFVVWGYGGFLKNQRVKSVPLVEIYLRSLDGVFGNTAKEKVIQTAATNLGLLRCGSIWKEGRLVGLLDFEEREFDVNFSDGNWRIYVPAHSQREFLGGELDGSDYPWVANQYLNKLLAFNTFSDNQMMSGKLLVPCVEFYERTYGRSAEVRRVLLTYPWREAEGRLYEPFTEEVSPGEWPVKLHRQLYDSDSVFVAHVQHDMFAKNRAKDIYAQLAQEAHNFPNAINRIAVKPWFRGAAKLKVRGISVLGGRHFLGLRIVGVSEPAGPRILSDREMTNKTDENEPTQPGSAWGGKKVSIKDDMKPLEVVDSLAPDHGSGSVEVLAEPLEVLGAPRKIRYVPRAKNREQPAHQQIDKNSNKWNSGDAEGSGKSVGRASVHTPDGVELESDGVLRDMWNAANHFLVQQPEIIIGVSWYTKATGFVSGREPELISFTPFKPDDISISTKTRRWVYRDWRAQLIRGLLLLRIVTPSKAIYILEIQRRIYFKQNDDGDNLTKEESYKGLVFNLDSAVDLDEILSEILAEIPSNSGVIDRLSILRSYNAYSFKHDVSKRDEVAAQSAFLNALKKMGIRPI